MPNNNKNIFQDIDFNKFASQITAAIKSAVETYWETDINIILQAVNDFREVREEKLCHGVDFFSSQIKVENHKPATIRLSKDFIENFLSTILESRIKDFKLTNLTQLEIKILNNFCEFLYKRIKEVLISPNDAKITEKSEKNINLLYCVSINEDECSQMMLSLPQDRFEMPKVQKNVSFKDEDFLTCATQVRIRAGSSKITLNDLQSLSTDDIVVLESSDVSKLTLISGELEKKFNVKVNEALIIKLDNKEDDNNNNEAQNEVEMEKNLWDDIQIEINAEFDKVKMTIGELKQITQGQIVDLGSVFNNEISLYVENKKVAKGELIIINDRYAVRLNEVLSTNKQNVQTTVQSHKPQPQTPPPKPQVQAKPAAQAKTQVNQNVQTKTPHPQAQPVKKPAPKPQPAAQKQSEDEEFDYSDFEK